MFAWLGLCCCLACGVPELPHHVWLEAESFAPLRGANFPFQPEGQQTRGSWSLAGPGAASAWTQGGESEFMSIAARADEPQEISVGRTVEIPAAGEYTLWVRYADYRAKQELFGVRVAQGGKSFAHLFGRASMVDELDPMKLLWDWSFAWDSTTVPLEKGLARVEIYTTGPTEARRHVDCLCLTTDATYHPAGREKPSFAAWAPLRRMQQAEMPPIEPQKKFALLLNYAAPNWPEGADRAAVRANLRGFQERFLGYIAGESISHAPVDPSVLESKVRAARSRADVLAALRELHTAAVRANFADYYGTPVTAEEAWGPVISCLSANLEAFAHALCHWGVRRT